MESFPGLVRGGGPGRHSALETVGRGPDQVRLVACQPSLGRLDVRYGGQLRPARLPPAGRGLPEPTGRLGKAVSQVLLLSPAIGQHLPPPPLQTPPPTHDPYPPPPTPAPPH